MRSCSSRGSRRSTAARATTRTPSRKASRGAAGSSPAPPRSWSASSPHSASRAAPAPQLRRLGVGDIVDRVFALYRAQPVLFIAIATVPYLILVLVIVGLGLAFATSFIGLIAVMNQAAEGRTPDVSTLASGMATFIVFV